MAAAVVDKFLACYTAEGGEVLPEDRQLLGELSAQLLRGLDGMLEEGSCAGEPGSCAGQIGALDCQALGPRLADELAPELGDLLGTELLAGLADEPPTAWAESYTMALGGKILDCYADELGQPPSGEEVAMVDGFRLQLARLLTLLTSRGSCKVDEQRQSGCTDALRAAPCAGLAEALTTSGQQLVETLTGACAGFLDCEARPQLDDLGGPRATRTGQALPTTPAEAR
ncbi:MAG: hypothetical protein FJ125_14720 [Deltaproteobacteria bacterium]|nr:hypothetical protein [Deltaproteobacteria bacterium]